MPERCVVAGCSNSKDVSKGISMHRIPYFGDERQVAKCRRVKWIEFIQQKRAKWLPSKSSVICSQHFKVDDFERRFVSLPGLQSPLKARLKEDKVGVSVVPSIYLSSVVEENSRPRNAKPDSSAKNRCTCKHIYICDHHKDVILKAKKNKRKRSPHSEDENDSADMVDFSQLHIGTLRRYRRHFKLQNKAGMNKSQLLETISRHFRSIPVPEKETITYFIYMVKTHRSKLDQRPGENI